MGSKEKDNHKKFSALILEKTNELAEHIKKLFTIPKDDLMDEVILTFIKAYAERTKEIIKKSSHEISKDEKKLESTKKSKNDEKKVMVVGTEEEKINILVKCKELIDSNTFEAKNVYRDIRKNIIIQKELEKKKLSVPETKTIEEQKRDAWMNAQLLKFNLERKSFAMRAEEATLKKYDFWSQQQVLKADHTLLSLRKIKKIHKYKSEEIKSEPRSLDIRRKNNKSEKLDKPIDLFEWDTKMDPRINSTLQEITDFINTNYYQEVVHKITYPKEFFKWLLNNDTKNYIVGVRLPFVQNQYTKLKKYVSDKVVKSIKKYNPQKDKGKLVGLIIGKVQKLRIYDEITDTLRCMFLTLTENLRKKGLAQELMTELKRLALFDSGGKVDTGIFSTDRFVPSPFTGYRLMHKYINNIEKLLDEKIITPIEGESRSERIKLSQLPKKTRLEFEELTEKNYKEAYDYFRGRNQFNVYPVFNENEFKNTFLGNRKAVRAFIIRDNYDQICDFVSYIKYQYKLMYPKDPKNTTVNVALLYYTVFGTHNAINKTIRDLMIIAKKDKCEVFNMYDTGENTLIFFEMKFEANERQFFMNFYNYKCVKLHSKCLGYISFE